MPIRNVRISVAGSARTPAADGPPPSAIPQAAKPRRIDRSCGVARAAAAQPKSAAARPQWLTAPGSARWAAQWVEGRRPKRARRRRRSQPISRIRRRSNDRGQLRYPQDQRQRGSGITAQVAQPAPAARWRRTFSQSTCSMRTEVPRPRSMLAPTLAPMAAAMIAINTNLATPVGTANAFAPADPPIDQNGTHEGFNCVAGRSRGRGIARIGRSVRLQRQAAKNRWYKAVSTQEDGRQRKCSQRPNRRRGRIDRGEFEAKSHEKEINRADRRELDDVFQARGPGSQSRAFFGGAGGGARSPSCGKRVSI